MSAYFETRTWATGASVGKAALHQPGRRRCLHHHLFASAAALLRPAHHRDPNLGRHDVQPLAHVLANAMQRAVVTGAGLSLDVDRDLELRQMGGQGPAVQAASGSVYSALATVCSASSGPSRSCSSGSFFALRLNQCN